MNLAQVPLLQNSSQSYSNNQNINHTNNFPINSEGSDSDKESYYFIPNTPSQRSLMDIQQPESPTFFKLLIMACLPCLIPPLCTPDKKKEFKKAPRTVIVGLSFIQLIMFIASLSLDGFASAADNWLLGPTGTALVKLGAKEASVMRYDYEMWRYFTPIFLHAGIIEIIINLFGQIRMGLYLERKWKWYIFLPIYVISGMGGIALSCDARPSHISVAASVSFIGVMGAYFAQLQLTWFKLEGWEKRTNLTICLAFILITFIEGLGHNYVDSFAHLGGFIVGLMQGYTIFGLHYARRWNPSKARAVPILGVICILFYFVFTITIFYTIVPVSTTDVYGYNEYLA